MAAENGVTAQKNDWATKCFRRPNTAWATERKFAAQMRLWATNIFVAQVSFGQRMLFRRSNWEHRAALLYFRRPTFGLRLSDVEIIFAAQCLGRRKCNIGRRNPPWPKTLFLVVYGPDKDQGYLRMGATNQSH